MKLLNTNYKILGVHLQRKSLSGTAIVPFFFIKSETYSKLKSFLSFERDVKSISIRMDPSFFRAEHILTY